MKLSFGDFNYSHRATMKANSNTVQSFIWNIKEFSSLPPSRTRTKDYAVGVINPHMTGLILLWYPQKLWAAKLHQALFPSLLPSPSPGKHRVPFK